MECGQRRSTSFLFSYVSYKSINPSAYRFSQAGLFSAVVTAFIIESYQWLRPDPTDMTNQLLHQIYAQLGSERTVGGIIPSAGPSNDEAGWLSAAERINICWFLSLTLSLATVLVGILCMQWVREYQHDAALPHADAISLRQMRFEGLIAWKVPNILSSLPLMLQIALVLFFIGVIDLLWSLDHRVAIPITVAISFLLIFLFATTMLPAFQLLWNGGRCLRQCAYKSPQSWIFCRLALFTIKGLRPFSWVVPRAKQCCRTLRSFMHCGSWNEYDLVWQQARREVEPQKHQQPHQGKPDDLSIGLTWIIQNFKQNADAVHAIHHCLLDVSLPTAARVVGALDSRVDQRLSSMLRPQLLRSYTGERRFLQPHSELKRDLVLAYFHEIHRQIHPESAIYQLEHIVRLMNSSEHWRLRPYLEWPIQDIRSYSEGKLPRVTFTALWYIYNKNRDDPRVPALPNCRVPEQ